MRITSRKKKKKNGPTGCVRGCVFALYDGRPFKGRWNNNNNSEVRTKQKRGVSQCKNLAKRRKWLKKPSPTPPQWPPPLWMRSHFLGERFFSFFSSYSWREYIFFFFISFYLISSKSTTMGRLVDQSGHYNRTVSVWCVSSFKAKRGKEGIGKGATNPSIQKARLIFLSAPTFHTHTHTSRPPSQSLALPAQPDRET